MLPYLMQLMLSKTSITSKADCVPYPLRRVFPSLCAVRLNTASRSICWLTRRHDRLVCSCSLAAAQNNPAGIILISVSFSTTIVMTSVALMSLCWQASVRFIAATVWLHLLNAITWLPPLRLAHVCMCVQTIGCAYKMPVAASIKFVWSLKSTYQRRHL